MAYPYYPYYQPPMPDNLAQLRQAAYQPPIPQQAPQAFSPAPPSPQLNTGIVWVGSDMEAANYLVAPNSAVALWNSNAPTVYLKQADASGKPTLKIYDLVERVSAPSTAPQAQNVEFATREELNAIVARIEALEPKKRAVKQDKDVKEAEHGE